MRGTFAAVVSVAAVASRIVGADTNTDAVAKESFQAERARMSTEIPRRTPASQRDMPAASLVIFYSVQGDQPSQILVLQLCYKWVVVFLLCYFESEGCCTVESSVPLMMTGYRTRVMTVAAYMGTSRPPSHLLR